MNGERKRREVAERSAWTSRGTGREGKRVVVKRSLERLPHVPQTTHRYIHTYTMYVIVLVVFFFSVWIQSRKFDLYGETPSKNNISVG